MNIPFLIIMRKESGLMDKVVGMINCFRMQVYHFR